MAFTPTVVRKADKPDRVARTPVELVQLEHAGWKAVRAASQKVAVAAGGSPVDLDKSKTP